MCFSGITQHQPGAWSALSQRPEVFVLLHYFSRLLVHLNRGDGATSVHISCLFDTFILKMEDPQRSIKKVCVLHCDCWAATLTESSANLIMCCSVWWLWQSFVYETREWRGHHSLPPAVCSLLKSAFVKHHVKKTSTRFPPHLFGELMEADVPLNGLDLNWFWDPQFIIWINRDGWSCPHKRRHKQFV